MVASDLAKRKYNEANEAQRVGLRGANCTSHKHCFAPTHDGSSLWRGTFLIGTLLEHSFLFILIRNISISFQIYNAISFQITCFFEFFQMMISSLFFFKFRFVFVFEMFFLFFLVFLNMFFFVFFQFFSVFFFDFSVFLILFFDAFFCFLEFFFFFCVFF